ncbi:RasGEF [Thoreauomyces humboldtii]|nr:RasGEF [Thoreauomyces humboldtii]
MRLKFAESLEALRDTVKGGSKKANKVTPESGIKHGRSSESLSSNKTSTRASTASNAGIGGSVDVLNSSSNSGTESPEAGRRNASRRLWAQRPSSSVPDLLGPSNRRTERGGEQGAEVLEDADSVSELQPGTIGRASIRKSSDGGSGATLALPVPSVPSSSSKRNSRRVSYGLFFKPGFSAASAAHATASLPGEDLNSINFDEEEEVEDDFGASGSFQDDASSGRPSRIRKSSDVSSRAPSDLAPEQSMLDFLAESRFSSANRPRKLGSFSGSSGGKAHESLHGSLPSVAVTLSVPSIETEAPQPGSISSDSLHQNIAALSSLDSQSELALSAAPRQDTPSMGKRRDPLRRIGPLIATAIQCQALRSALHPAVLEPLDIRDVLPDTDPRSYLLLRDVTEPPSLTMEASSGEGPPQIESGTLPALIQRLASEGATDVTYLLDFLTTYRYFADSADVARLLIARYVTPSCMSDASISETPSDKSAQVAPAAWAAFLQLKILNVFKKWIEVYPADFLTSPTEPGDQVGLRELVTAFLTYHVARDERRAPFATAILQNMIEKTNPGFTTENQRLQVPQPLSHGMSEPNLTTGRRSSGGTGTELRMNPAAARFTLSRTMSPITLDTSIRSRRLSVQAGVDASVLARGASAIDLAATGHARSATAPPLTRSDSGPALGSGSTDLSTLAEFNPEILAQQLTLLEHASFRNITAYELFQQGWNVNPSIVQHPPRALNLTALIAWFNRIAYGVATQVITQHDFKTRVSLVKRFIHVAHMCYSWGNFNTVFEIVAGLNLAPVARLKRTWKALPKKYAEVWDHLNAVVSSENSYKTYRAALRHAQQQDAKEAILPYLGVTLSDLTFAEDGNPTFVQPTTSESTAQPLVYFTKFRLVATLVRSVAQLQARGDYSAVFAPDIRIQRFLLHDWGVLDDAELYATSLRSEARLVSS